MAPPNSPAKISGLPLGTVSLDDDIVFVDNADGVTKRSPSSGLVDLAGTVTNVSSANSDISVANPTTTPVLTANTWTGANQILKLDGTAKIPAVDWSALTGLTKTQIGLSSVDNTSDASKPVSTAQAAAIAVVQSDVDTHEANTSNPHSVTKTQVGLGNAENTADLAKPISTATQTALNAKQDTLVSGTNIKTINGTTVLGSGNITTGDASTNTSSSVDGEMPLFSGTAGKTFKRSTLTGLLKSTSGVPSAATAGTDYTTPSSSETVTNKSISLSSNTVTSTKAQLNTAVTDGDVMFLDSVDTITAVKTFSASPIVPTPAGDTDAANKAYVDTVAQGLSAKWSVLAASAAALPTNTYLSGVITITATGTLTVDWVVTALNDRILVKDEASQLKNGVYKVTIAGAIGVSAVLTRSTDMDVSAEFPGAFVFVESGTVNTAAGFVCTNSTPPTVGTTAITFTQFSGAGQITAGNALTKTGNVLDVNVDDSTIEISGDALRVKNSGITYAKIQNVSATDKVLGRSTAGAGVIEEISTTGSGNVVRATSPVLVTPNLGTPSALVATNASGTASALTAGNVTTNANLTGDVTSVGNAATIGANKVTLGMQATLAANTAIANATGSTATPTAVPMVSAATASAIAIRDSNANALFNNVVKEISVITTAAGTTTLTVASDYNQQFTGSTTQTVVLPVASTVTLGHSFMLMNRSSGAVTVNSSGGNLVQTMAASSQTLVTCVRASGTDAASWDSAYSITNAGSGGGTVTSVSVASANGFAGSVANATTTPAITISTSVTGLLKGNGTAVSAATAGTDYSTPSSTDTLTNKSMSLGTNTLTTTKAQLDTAITDGNGVYVGDNATQLNMATARLLGRTTASAGAVEEITVGAGLSLSAGTLTASGWNTFNGAVVRNDGTITVTTTNTGVAFNGEDIDTNTYHDNASNNTRLTVPSTGKYKITFDGVAYMSASVADINLYTSIRKNGATMIINRKNTLFPSGSGSRFVPFTVDAIISLTTSDYVELMVQKDSTGNTVQLNADGTSQYATIGKIQNLGT